MRYADNTRGASAASASAPERPRNMCARPMQAFKDGKYFKGLRLLLGDSPLPLVKDISARWDSAVALESFAILRIFPYFEPSFPAARAAAVTLEMER
jgi:hypothetical protein